MKSNQVLSTLKSEVEELIRLVQSNFKEVQLAQLNWKENAEKWSILECLEHLNRYSRYYNLQIKKAIQKLITKNRKSKEDFKPGILGKYFTNMIDPANMKKMKTQKHMNPVNSSLDRKVIKEFIQHQESLLQLIAQAESVDLNAIIVPVEFMKIIKMRLGDTLRFTVMHEKRHIQQAINVYNVAKNAKMEA